MTIASFFSSKTRHGRAIRTFLQVLLGLITFASGLLAIPGLLEAFQGSGLAVQASTFATWVGIVSYLQNALEALIKSLKD